jgi:hypothetical protein
LLVASWSGLQAVRAIIIKASKEFDISFFIVFSLKSIC